MDLLIHGIYDANTLDTLLSKSVSRLGFDLRARSFNLIPFATLKEFIRELKGAPFHLIFENEKEATILSFLDLLKEFKHQMILEFRDQLPANFYHHLNHPFFWTFHPSADWQSILEVENLKGVLLPTQWRSLYQTLPLLWDTIEKRQLVTYLHLNQLKELESVPLDSTLKLSIDLTSEVESGYRRVDQEKLKSLKLWRSHHENIAGQR